MSEHPRAEALSTADLFDSAPDKYLQLDVPLRHFGGRERFHGPCSTVRADSDPFVARQAIDEQGAGRILVIDGSAVPDLACLGDIMAARARANGWLGAVILGAVRDTAVLAEMDFGVVALRSTAKRPFGDKPGERDVSLHWGDITIEPGDTLFVDRDAVLILPR